MSVPFFAVICRHNRQVEKQQRFPTIKRLDDQLGPWLEPYITYTVIVNDHRIRVQEVGNPNGVPVIVFHGGPGGRIVSYRNRVFNAAKHRGIVFDQPGCGNSRPFGPTAENTTQLVMEAAEAIRTYNRIDQWVVIGSSWGSTIALVYAETHPEHVKAIVVSGIFLADTEAIDWWWTGVGSVYPEVVQHRRSILNVDEQHDIRTAFENRILDGTNRVAEEAAWVLDATETMTLDVLPQSTQPPTDQTEIDDALAYMRMFAHYSRHNFFLKPDQIINNINRIKHIPGHVINGRFDMCTPSSGAAKLAKAWGAPLTIVSSAGHRWNDQPLAGTVAKVLDHLT